MPFNGGELGTTGRVPQRQDAGAAPVVASGLGAHDVHVAVVHRQASARAHGHAAAEPLVVQGHRGTQPHRNDQLPLTVAMEANAAGGRVVVVVALRLQQARLGAEEGRQRRPQPARQRHRVEGDDATTLFLVARLLRLLPEAQVVARHLVDHAAVHPGLGIHGQRVLLSEEVIRGSVSQPTGLDGSAIAITITTTTTTGATGSTSSGSLGGHFSHGEERDVILVLVLVGVSL
mmetsp:Transcript_37206/g.103881  ORF Transcript_37206/g.103881 Transcript_37206/m.103881 type:complete len:232 (+) Transcript_37206:305-1000(+)